jgi:FtsP/CotA-like multicopper oxidase with cupredoxin domain
LPPDAHFLRSGRGRLFVAVLATAALVVPIAWMWAASLMPSSYSVLRMGPADTGGVAAAHAHLSGAPGDRDVTTLVDPAKGPPDVAVTLVARREKVTIPGGPTLTAYTLNGTTPGPTIRATEGQLVEVTLVNESVPDGATLHWHGLSVPGGVDGVAGVTQDAVPVGGRHVYRFTADKDGTYWYQSHQVSHEQVIKGLLGAVVVAPKAGLGADVDVVGLAHLYSGRRTVQGHVGDVPVEVAAGRAARVRIINTDAGIMPVWVSGASFQVVAVDGVDLHGPTPVSGKKVLLPGGGRVDLLVQVPAGGGAVRVEMGGAALVVGPAGSAAAPTRAPRDAVDLLGYGTPAPLDFDPSRPDRRFDYSIGRRPGFVNGRPGVQWTINGKLFPAVPMFMVAEGDVAVMRIDNHSGETHPMHLHGHHVLVLSRDGVRSTGSPWWTDSLEVGSGQVVEVAFVADNPGIWMDHCHNLPHAQEGLVAHLMYEGVTTRFRLGRDTPNSPE